MPGSWPPLFRRGRNKTGFRGYCLPIVAGLVVTALLNCGGGTPAPGKVGPVRVVVYTQNLFIGADLLSLGQQRFRGKSLGIILREVEGKVDRIMEAVEFHDFPSRAGGLALEVNKAKPDVILLQEVTLLRKRACGGHWGWVALAQTCVYDYLRILQAALRERGLRYRVAAVSENFDEEVPSKAYGYVRFTDRDAVLVHEDLTVKSARSQHFNNQWERRVAFRTISLRKGYQEVTIEKEGRLFRAVNLHMERLGVHKRAQNEELLSRFGVPDMATVIGGDFNADPGSDISFFRPWKVRYRDAWGSLHGNRSGGTCCFRIPLVHVGHNPGSRWDVILASVQFKLRRASLVKGRVKSHIRPGNALWLSDHAGLVAELEL